MRLKKILCLVIFLLFLPVLVFSIEPMTIDDYIQKHQEILQKYENGETSYLEMKMDLWGLRHKNVIVNDEDIERLGMELMRTEKAIVYLDQRYSKGKLEDVIYVNNDKEKKCELVVAHESGEHLYKCEFGAKIYGKTIFKGEHDKYANLTVIKEDYPKIEENNYENAVFETKYSVSVMGSFVGASTLIINKDVSELTEEILSELISEQNYTERLLRKVVEDSFPGVGKAICDRNILNREGLKNILFEIKGSTLSTLGTYPYYDFKPINEEYSVSDELKDCFVYIYEELEELKMFKCGDFILEGYRFYETENCKEEVVKQVLVPKMKFNIKIKKTWVDRGFKDSWEKMKEIKFEPVEIEKYEPGLSEAIKKTGVKFNYSVSVLVYNDEGGLFEMTSYITEKGVRDMKPEFFEKSDVRVKVKSDAIYNIYANNWALEGELPENHIDEGIRIFMGGIDTIIDFLRAGVSREIVVEPFWNIGKMKSALDGLTAFKSCTEEFFEKTKKNETSVFEFNKCYNELK